LEPADAFGDYDERLLFLEPLSKLPKDITEGMAFEGLPEGCNPDAPKDRIYFVSDIYPEHAVLDGNHPLAGIGLRLHLTVHEVREAYEEEIGRGTLGAGFFNMQVEPVATKAADGSNPTLH
jgi:FKBP-type peptidyl-prolyl cis-trans isomerase SlyD